MHSSVSFLLIVGVVAFSSSLGEVENDEIAISCTTTLQHEWHVRYWGCNGISPCRQECSSPTTARVRQVKTAHDLRISQDEGLQKLARIDASASLKKVHLDAETMHKKAKVEATTKKSREKILSLSAVLGQTNNEVDTVCADGEGTTCTCTGIVTYGRKFISGKPGSGATTTLTQMKSGAHKEKQVSGSVKCSNSAMGGDPSRGYYKHCICAASTSSASSRTPTPTPTPTGQDKAAVTKGEDAAPAEAVNKNLSAEVETALSSFAPDTNATTRNATMAMQPSGGTGVILMTTVRAGNMMAKAMIPQQCPPASKNADWKKGRWSEVGGHIGGWRHKHGRYTPVAKVCKSLSQVKTSTIQSNSSFGTRADVMLKRAKTDVLNNIYGGWYYTYNCRCNPYIQVETSVPFITNRVSVKISGAPLCNNKKPFGDVVYHGGRRRKWHNGDKVISKTQYKEFGDRMSCGAKDGPSQYMQATLYSRAKTNAEWAKYPKDFTFDQPTAFDLALPTHLRALQLRVMLYCTPQPDVDSKPGCINPRVAPVDLTNGHATFEPEYRSIEVKVHGDDTKFDWNEDVKKSLVNIIKESPVAGGFPALNCTRVNNDATIMEHFKLWRTPGDGSFLQEPDVDSKAATLTDSSSQNTWQAFASKRNTASFEFHVEKRLICIQEGGKQDAQDVAPRPMACCVNKLIWALSNRTASTAKNERMKAAILRNF